MRECQKPQYTRQSQRRSDHDCKLLRRLAHDRAKDEHTGKLGHHQDRKDRNIVGGISAQSMLHIVNSHSRNEIHASLAKEVEPQEDQEGTAPENTCRLSEALGKGHLYGFLLLLPRAEENGDRTNEEEHAKEEHALHILRRIVCLLDDHPRNQAADGGAERREHHTHVGEFRTHRVVIHHVGKQAVIWHTQHREARVEQAVHHNIEDVVRRHRRCVDIDPHEHESEGRNNASHQNVEALRPIFRLGSLNNVAHDGIGYGIPDLADHGDRAGKSRVHTEGVRQEDDEECVDDDEASSAEDLSHAVNQSAEEAVTRLSAADSLFHISSLSPVACSAPADQRKP